MTGEDERIEMEIRKRNGESVPFQQEKIFNAMKKAFDGQGKEIGSREMDEILATVLNNLSVTVPLTVERVQDEVERTLMERGHYEVAKAYILYREKRSALRRVRHTIAQTVGDNSLDEVLRRIQMDFTEEVYSLAALQMKFESFCRPGMTEDERAEALTKAAVELTTAEAPKWEFIAARLLNHSFRCRNAQEWEGRGVGDLYGKLRYLTDKGLYGDYILAHYTHEEIAMAEGFLAADAILNIMLNVTDGIVVYPKVIRSRLMAELPFMASENIMMQAVEKGGNRQELHERLRQHAIAAGKQVKEEGLPNDMVDRIAADPAFGLTKEEIVAGLVPENFVGRAPQQVEEFIAHILKPIFDANPDAVEQHASLSV